MQRIDLQFVDAILDKSGLFWFFDKIHMGLFVADKGINQVRLIRKVSADCKLDSFQAMKMYTYKNDLFITSHRDTCILRYEKKKNKFSFISNPQEVVQDNIYYNTAFWNDKIIYIPQQLDSETYVYDLVSETYSKKVWLKKEEEDLKGRGVFICQYNNVVWIPVQGTNYMYKLNGENFIYEKVSLDKDINLNSICVCNEKIWLTQDNKMELRVWAEKGNDSITIDEKNVWNAFSHIISVGNKIVLLPRFSNYVYIYDYKNKSICKLEMISMERGNVEKAASLCIGYYIDDTKVYLWPWSLPDIYVLDVDKEKLEKCEAKVSMVEYAKIIGQSILWETDCTDLENFLEL